MTDTIMQGAMWITAGGLIMFFLKRRRARKSVQ
jgi:hypothetical protein